MSQVGVYHGEELARYGFGDDHPFSNKRQDYFWDEAQRLTLSLFVSHLDPVMASEAQLNAFHSPDYVRKVRDLSVSGEGFLDRGDTPAYAGVYEAAAHVCGSAIEAADRIMKAELRRIFIPIAGLHHAHPHTASGFCVFNDAGVVIEHLRAAHGVTRVAYVDIDAHHGDGVFYAYESDPEVIFADLHEDGRFIFPGTGHADETGKGEAEGRKLNIPLPPHADDNAFFEAWPQVEAMLREYKPEFILFQTGADCIADDPITRLNFSVSPHAYSARRICEIAEELGHGRVLGLGGGGYNPRNIAQGWCAVLRAFIETPMTALGE
ncbi:acetoin utilization protein AcuC [Magnetofaba australis]|uniref:Putative histone deacetylase superfamily protein n=1 Tax=Magnetofaba australis IT-1 TaxID=1434232 RepID=A0A1Y2K5A0_9PROT|nr:acetoin utilization protein AcuC [Magnetofaba australis]OSM04872.1 putative histone deacetylase superfamily protein [Magnetofaba australis IT-1]